MIVQWGVKKLDELDVLVNYSSQSMFTPCTRVIQCADSKLWRFYCHAQITKLNAVTPYSDQIPAFRSHMLLLDCPTISKIIGS